MAWIESHQSLAGHRKTRKLARLLGTSIPATIGHLHLLWWWCLDNAPDGDLSKIDECDLAAAALWKKDQSLFFSALVDAEFIDNGGKTLHDWYQYAGKLTEKREERREQNREAQQRHRAKRAELASRQHIVSADNADSKPSTVPTVPNRTIHYHKESKKKTIPIKQKMGEFLNVFLTTEEYGKLIAKFGDTDTKERIERLSSGIASKGYKYKDHYATILNWARRDKEEKGGVNQRNPRKIPKASELPEPEDL